MLGGIEEEQTHGGVCLPYLKAAAAIMSAKGKLPGRTLSALTELFIASKRAAVTSLASLWLIVIQRPSSV